MTPETQVLVVIRKKGWSNLNFFKDNLPIEEWNWLKGVAWDYSINRCDYEVTTACNLGWRNNESSKH